MANHARSSSQSLEDLSAHELDLSYAVNVRATLLLIQAFAVGHDRNRGGRVVLFTSGQYHAAMPGELRFRRSWLGVPMGGGGGTHVMVRSSAHVGESVSIGVLQSGRPPSPP